MLLNAHSSLKRENKIMKAPLKKKRKMCYSFFPFFFEQLAGFSASKVNAVREIFTGQDRKLLLKFLTQDWCTSLLLVLFHLEVSLFIMN